MELPDEDVSALQEPGNQVYMLGHPMGLPLKFTPDGTIGKQYRDDFRNTNLDAFSGNSGSPVFSVKEKKLIGIFTKGRPDNLVWDPELEAYKFESAVITSSLDAIEKFQVIQTPLAAYRDWQSEQSKNVPPKG